MGFVSPFQTKRRKENHLVTGGTACGALVHPARVGVLWFPLEGCVSMDGLGTPCVPSFIWAERLLYA